MIHMLSDYKLSKTITAFEAYMFASADKYTHTHSDGKFTDFEIALCDGRSSQILTDIDTIDIAKRKKAVTAFNKMLAGYGISASKDGLKTVTFIAYAMPEDNKPFDAMAELKIFREAVMEFAVLTKRPVCVTFHADQLDDDETGYLYPHAHVLMQHLKAESDILQIFVCAALKLKGITVDREDQQFDTEQFQTAKGVSVIRVGPEIRCSNGDWYIACSKMLFCRDAGARKLSLAHDVPSIKHAVKKILDNYGGSV